MSKSNDLFEQLFYINPSNEKTTEREYKEHVWRAICKIENRLRDLEKDGEESD